MKLTKKNLIIIICTVLALILIIGVIYAIPKTPYNSNKLILSRNSSGGITGRGDGYNISIKGNEMTYDGKTTELSDNQILLLRRKIDSTGFNHMREEYGGNKCCDMLGTSIWLAEGDTIKTVSFTDGGFGNDGVPAGLIELDNYIVSLAR